MELKRVEIIGFKSFPEKIEVEFGKGITAIVGPNGSGKSNISDAVRWVLGEQSAKTLRGSRMEDVIFAGTERRKPVNFAQVTLVLDNQDHRMAVDYDEVAITRRVYRSGESEYQINGSRCRLRDVQEMLMDTGIGKDGYSVIGQGQIDQLLSTKPQDRRMIFEEAAGIVKYKTRKEQAEKQLAEEADSLNRVTDILTELTARLEPLQKQAETAARYLELKEQLKTYEVASFLGEYTQLREQYERVSGLLEDLTEQLEGSRARQQAARQRSEQYAQEADEARKQLTKLYEEHNQLQLQKESCEGDKKVLQQQAETDEREYASLQLRLQDVKQRLNSRTETVRKEEVRLKEIAQQIEEEEIRGAQTVQQLEEKQKKLETLNEALNQARQQVQELAQELGLLRSQTERHAVVLEQDLSQQESMENRGFELTQTEESQKQQLEAAQQKAEQLQAQQEQQAQQTESLRQAVQQKRQQLQEKQQAQEKLILSMRDYQNRIRWLRGMEEDYEGFSGSVKAVMQLKKQNPKQYASIHGTLADLIRVPAEYALAIEIALGAAIQNIVVENTAGAKQLIQMLRDTKKGRATFLPLDSVTGRSAYTKEEAVRDMPGIIGFAGDLIQYDPAYQKIISRQLGNVVIAEDFDSASRAARRYGSVLRLVTLKGDIFNIGGSITGGSTGGKTGGILSRKGELEKLQEQLNQKREEGRSLQNEMSQLSQKRQELSHRLDAAEAEEKRLQQEYNEARQTFEQLQFIHSHTLEQLQEMEENRSRLQQSRQEHEEAVRKSRSRLQQMEQDQAERMRRQEEAERALQVLSGQLEAEKGQQAQQKMELAGLQQQKQFMERTVQWETQEIENLAQEADQILEDRQQRADSAQSAKNQILLMQQKQEQLDLAIARKSEEMQQMEEQRAAKDRQRDRSIRENEENLRIFSGLEKEQVRLENQAARAKKDLTDLQDRIWEEYELTYGAAKALWEKQSPEDQKQLGSQTAMKKQVSRLKESIRQLGPVNVGAIEELTALTERCEFLTKQRDDIAESEASLREVIRQLTEKMEDQFARGFAAISKTFNEVFRKLFGGGQGILKLADGENALEAGIEIIAQPPGKKLQSMMLLSGGERALTAISLLFAIHQLNPAPFCILDEIEAALDDANVGRYAAYLREMCAHTQFIVITHRKGTMEAADTMYGVTMEEKGVSKCISVQFE